MHNTLDIQSEAHRLLNLFDQLPAGWEFDPAYDDLEREYAELRMAFGTN